MAPASDALWRGSPLGRPPAARSAAVAAPMRSKGVGWGGPPASSEPGPSAEISIFQFFHVGRFWGSRSWETPFTHTRRAACSSVQRPWGGLQWIGRRQERFAAQRWEENTPGPGRASKARKTAPKPIRGLSPGPVRAALVVRPQGVPPGIDALCSPDFKKLGVKCAEQAQGIFGNHPFRFLAQSGNERRPCAE